MVRNTSWFFFWFLLKPPVFRSLLEIQEVFLLVTALTSMDGLPPPSEPPQSLPRSLISQLMETENITFVSHRLNLTKLVQQQTLMLLPMILVKSMSQQKRILLNSSTPSSQQDFTSSSHLEITILKTALRSPNPIPFSLELDFQLLLH